MQAASASAGLSFSWVAASEHDEREALAERAAGVEVRRERDRSARVDERAGRRHRTRKEERAGGQQHTSHVALGQRGDTLWPGRLEVVDRTRAELDRERNRTRLRELVTMEPQLEAVRAARLEIATSLRSVERASLEEDVCGLGELRRLREDVGQDEIEIGVCVRVPGRCGMRTEPRRDPTRRSDRAQRRQLGLAVEAVARLSLERRRAGTQHPIAVSLHRLGDAGFSCGPGRPDGREDAEARCVQLLVARAGCAARELLDAVAAKRRVRMAVDEAGDGAEAATVELLDVPIERRQLRHRAHCLDRPAVAEHVRALDELPLAQAGSTQWCVTPSG